MADEASTDTQSTRPSTSSEAGSSKLPNMRPGGTPFAGLFPPLGAAATNASTSSGSSSSASSSSSATHDALQAPYHSAPSSGASSGIPGGGGPAVHALGASSAAPQPIPEKCLTFCSSRADAPSMCRMFCLRKKAVLATREEELARLRPNTAAHRASNARDSSKAGEADEGSVGKALSSAWESFTPLQSLRRTLAPYSFVYIKGTASGVVGRYMEELEGDDGHRDFGPESRHAEEKRGKEREIAWYSWGHEGALLYVPLTSLFHPVLSIPSTLSFFLSPPLRFLSAYRDSFTDGTQLRNIKLLWDASTDGSAYRMADKLITHHRAKVAAVLERRQAVLAEREAQAEEERAGMQAQLDEQMREKREALEAHTRKVEALKDQQRQGQSQAPTQSQGPASPTGARRGGLRDRLEEAMDRERARGGDDRVRDADKEREA